MFINFKQFKTFRSYQYVEGTDMYDMLINMFKNHNEMLSRC